MAVRPRQLCFRGSVRANGLLVDVYLLGEIEARTRVLAQWHRGARLFRLPVGLALVWAEPRRLTAASADGAPIVEQRGALSTVPLDEDEQRAVAAPLGGLIVAVGGEARSFKLLRNIEEDPARWLELEGLRWASVQPVVGPPPVVPASAADVEVDARALLLDDTAVPPGLAELASSLHGGPKTGSAAAGAGAGSTADGRGMWGTLGRWFGFGGTAGAGAAPGGGEPVAPSAWERLFDVFRGEAARAIMSSPLGRSLGRAQAEYLEKMMSMFESGDLERALRHAIGLKGVASGRTRPRLGVPSPRGDLDFSFGAGGGSSSAFLTGDALYGYLQQLYRRAYEQLAAAGRVREAAYVLVELLGAYDEAVEYLEQQGQFKLAAQLAEAHGLPAGRVVRQWWLAGDTDRALAIARRTGAFSVAVMLLERTHPDDAERLRLLWADTLADSGDLVAAAGCLRGHAGFRELEQAFLERALAAGGVQGAKAAPRLLQLAPELAERTLRFARELTDADDEEGAPARSALISALVEVGANSGPAVRALKAPALRAGVRDLGNNQPALAFPALRTLASSDVDIGLRTDIPPLSRPAWTPLIKRKQPIEHTAAVGDRGSLEAWDAAALQQGGFLLALGEAGARHTTADLRSLTTLPAPAEHVVVSEHGGMALTAVRRGPRWLLNRLRFGTGAAPLFAVEADALCTWTDGVRLAVSRDDEVIALDLSAPKPSSLWRVHDVGGRVLGLSAGPEGLTFLVSSGAPGAWPEAWRFSSPELTLRERVPLSGPPDVEPLAVTSGRAAHHNARRWAAIVETERGPMLGWAVADAPTMWMELGGDVLSAEVVHVDEHLALTAVVRPAGALVHAWASASAPHLVVRLRGASRVRARVDHGVLAVTDDIGRLLSLDLERGHLLRDLRLR